uniref:Uncharacterized protein n=1 Tax=Arundo donax TaxID=35708 RepID=A0A0A9AZ29_ARUDO
MGKPIFAKRISEQSPRDC